MYGDSLVDATENVSKSDYARSSYYRTISGRDWNEPHHYDMCIDASEGVEFCADVICDFYKSMNN